MYPFTVIFTDDRGTPRVETTRALCGAEAAGHFTMDQATGAPLEGVRLMAVLSGHHADVSDDEEAPAQADIADIARDCLGISTLATRNSDAADFHDLAVWAVREALERAFEAGRAQATL